MSHWDEKDGVKPVVKSTDMRREMVYCAAVTAALAIQKATVDTTVSSFRRFFLKLLCETACISCAELLLIAGCTRHLRYLLSCGYAHHMRPCPCQSAHCVLR